MKGAKGLVKLGMLYTFSNFLQKGIGFIVFMYLANFLPTSEYALFGLDYSLLTIISALSFAGIYEAQISSYMDYKRRGSEDQLFIGGNTLFLFSATASFLIFFIFYLLGRDEPLSRYWTIASGALFLSFFTYQSIIIRMRNEEITSVIFSFFPMVLSYLGGFICVYVFKTSSAFFVGSFTSLILSTLILLPLMIRKKISFGFNKEVLRDLVKNLMPYIVIALLMWISGYGNTYVINYFFTDTDVAIFVFLFTLSSILQLAASSMNQVWVPKFYNDYGTHSVDQLETKYKRYTIFQGSIIGTIGFSIILILPFIFGFFVNYKKFDGRSLELFYLFAGYIVSIPWWHCQNYYMINNNGNNLMKLSLYSSLVGYFIWFFTMYVLGPIGIYIGFFMQMLTRSVFIYFDARKNYKVRFDWEGVSIGLFLLLLSLAIINFLY